MRLQVNNLILRVGQFSFTALLFQEAERAGENECDVPIYMW